MAKVWKPASEVPVNQIYERFKYINSEGQTCISMSPQLLYKGNGKGNGFWWMYDDFDEVMEQDPDIENIIEIEVELFGKESDDHNKQNFDISTHMSNLIGLFNDTYCTEGPHELDNSWTSYDFYEIADELQNRNFYIWGIATAPYSGSLGGKPTAFVCEDMLTGDRFWTHTKDEWVFKMREQMAWAYNQLFGVKEWKPEEDDYYYTQMEGYEE